MTQSIGPIDLVMRHLGKDFKEACRWLADEHNIILDEWKPAQTDEVQKPFDATRFERFFERPWLLPEARKFLFDERRIDPRVVRWCRLTSWKDKQGVPWLQIPYFNREGKLIGIQNRNLIKGAEPRFRFPQGGGSISLYNLPVLNLLKPGEQLFITEGCSDCWAMLSAGHKAIAIPSATLLTQDVRSKMADGRSNSSLLTLHSSLGITFHMFPDRDAPGERLFLQLQQVLPSIVHHQLPPDCKDFSDYYLAHKSG
jgi:DNA primase